MVQYKEEAETTWKNRSHETFSPIYTEYLVDNLKAGRKYFMRVLLVDESLKTNDPELSTMSEVSTNCRVSKIETNLNVTKVTKTSIAIIWNKELVKLDDKECPFESYILDIEKPRDDFVENRKIVNIQSNSLVIRSLLPGTTYTISLKKSTVHGESSTVSHVQATTDQSKDSVMDVAGLKTKTIGSEINLKWFKSAIIRTYYIKYRLLKLLACSHEELQSPLQVVPTKSTNYTLKLSPNALYEIFVTGDETLLTSANKRIIVTEGTLPDIAPTLLKQEFRLTNESAAIYWKDLPANCQKMNGFFKKYLLELMDIQNTIINTYETVDRKMEITGLDPKTEYNLRVKYVNHIGSNNQIYDEGSFLTRATSFLIAQDFTAYKTSANTIGIRWKMPEYNSTITRIEKNQDFFCLVTF
uniref:Fibronectin type-III domain-containing protein n=1 Tax=Cacopsylla melanoneura TaxID=428564 RepID=A0A8D8SD16_9HEMI